MFLIKIFFLIFLEIELLTFLKSYRRPTKPPYNHELANYLHLLCYESYFVDAGRCIPQLVPYFESFKLYESKVVICDKSKNQCGYYVLVSENIGTIILIFSGTVANSQFLKQSLSYFQKRIYYSNSGFVNRYYAESFEMIWGHAKNIICNRRYGSFTVYITGHSLGAVYAALAAFKISYLKYREDKDIYLYTFGGPRIGSLEFAKNFDRLVPNSYRVVVGSDFIPHFPPCTKMKERNVKFYKKLFRKRKSRPCDPHDQNGYYHHGVEVWYPLGTTSKYFICNGYPKNEDFGCSDGLVYYKRRLREYRRNHSIYFEELTDRYVDIFLYKPNKKCKIIKDPNNRRIDLGY
uniref:Lipase_3 domain-containing protein n=1 Tax=Strongyloides venezuelensis TaxID=75913 RepID=A0A0K0F3P5_STRVS